MSAHDLHLLTPWQKALGCVRHRGLLWLSGSPELTRTRAQAITTGLSLSQVLWVGTPDHQRPEGAMDTLAMKKARTRLGGEQGAVVFDAHNGFDPDAFGALAGTVCAGGLLILLTPMPWGENPDPDYARLADYPHAWSALSARYLQRLAQILMQSPDVARWQEDDAKGLYLPEVGDGKRTGISVTDPDCLSEDQALAVMAIARLRRRRPLVLTADRGRGKSAALGIGAARRLRAGDRRILITAPRPASVAPVFERLKALLPDAEQCDNALFWQDREVRFVSPDVLMAHAGAWGGDGSVLLVDEAAALPAALLAQALMHFPRVVFATTVHGYEGSGRGFALRFRARLEQHTPQWKALTLHTPVRWGENDPLEHITTQLLALAAEPPALEQLPAVHHHHRLDRSVLAHDEAHLQAVFGLLVQAHYRTSPADLRALLDGPGIGIETLESAGIPGTGTLLAVAVTVDEGGFEAGLAEQIARGERRPRGHLMAQSLALHAGVVTAATHRLRRIMRLAVHPQAQRHGLGQQMVAKVAAGAREAGIDLLGTSFGAEPGLIAFWQHCGLSTVRLGLHPETATGEYPVMMSQLLSPSGDMLQKMLEHALTEQLPALLAFELRALSPEVVAGVLRDQALSEPDQKETHIQLTRLAEGLAPLVPSRHALARAVHQALVATRGHRPAPALVTLCGLLWQGRTLEWLARREGLTGSAQAMAWIRQQARALMEMAL